MKDINDMVELQKIGGQEKYKMYYGRIRDFIKSSPTKDEMVIARGTGVPLIAIRRALREGVYEKVTAVVTPEDAEFLKQKAALLSSIAANRAPQPPVAKPKSKLVSDLNAKKNIK